jgi:hypothetical protein
MRALVFILNRIRFISWGIEGNVFVIFEKVIPGKEKHV